MNVDELGQIAVDINQNKKTSAVARLGKVVADAISDIPGIGKLTQATIDGLAQYSAYSKVSAALKALDTEAAEVEKAARIAQAVHQTLHEHLNSLSDGQQAIAQALVRLDSWLDATRRELADGQDEIYQKLVSGGATGVILEAGRDRGADIRQDHVTGKGTTGVIIKGRG